MNHTGSDHLALVGLSGSGKSSLAPLLAARLGATAADLDRVIEQQLGASVAEIFASRGEAAFRSAESDALHEMLSGPPIVLATGGGVVLDAGNRSLLRRGATVVWLRADVDELERRLSDTTEARPLLAGDAHFALDRLAQEREALYAEVSDVVIDVDGVALVDLVHEVLDAIGWQR